jgi:hypothetical protein
MSTLDRIRTKVRRLTATSRTTQLSDAVIDQYVNDFYLYDMPGHLRLFDLKTIYIFYTQPNVDVYAFDKNAYSSVGEPIYIAGYEGFFSESRRQFYMQYPDLEYNQLLTTGDGSQGPYTGTLSNVPILRRGPPSGDPYFSRVLASAVDNTGVSETFTDTAVSGDTGTLTGSLGGSGTINYTTGAVSLTFANGIPSGNNIQVQTIPFNATMPTSLLFYDNLFFLRPVPDQSYKIELDAYVFPTTLLNDGDSPLVQQWWQYLAFGAAKKVFEDRGDMEGAAMIMGSFKEQERIVQRRTIVDYSQQRVPTIYTEQTTYGSAQNWRQY